MASNVSLQIVRNSAAKPSSQFVHYMCCRWSWYHYHLHNYTLDQLCLLERVLLEPAQQQPFWGIILLCHQIEKSETDGIILCNLRPIFTPLHGVGFKAGDCYKFEKCHCPCPSHPKGIGQSLFSVPVSSLGILLGYVVTLTKITKTVRNPEIYLFLSHVHLSKLSGALH